MVNIIVPELGVEAVLKSVKDAQANANDLLIAEKNTAKDFYFHRNVDTHIDQWFSKKTLENIVPAYPIKILPRFAHARMMLYKRPPLRLIGGEPNEDYEKIAYRLDTIAKTCSELTWLLRDTATRTRWNERRQRLEYDVMTTEYQSIILEGEREPFAVVYEIAKDARGNRMFIYWSETRDGVAGQHFKFSQGGEMYPVGNNEKMLNPYGILPFTFAHYDTGAEDIVRAAIQIGIAMTQLAVDRRLKGGQPVITGMSQDDVKKLEQGADKLWGIPDGASFSRVSSATELMDVIESVKMDANMAAENNHLRIRWGESGGNAPSGEALKILEIENLESRESDIPIWTEWEEDRYLVDRAVLKYHFKEFPEEYQVDFQEVSFPLSVDEKHKDWDWKFKHGYDLEDYLRSENPDITDEEVAERLAKSAPKEDDLLTALEAPIV